MSAKNSIFLKYHVQVTLVVAVLSLCFFLFHALTLNLVKPESDSVKFYINYAETLNRSGVFGFSQTNDSPSNFITPLYPALLSAVMTLDSGTKRTFKCLKLSKLKGYRECELEHKAIIVIQYFIAMLSLLLVWLISYELIQNYTIAWLSTVAAMLSGRLSYFADLIMTENLVIFFQCLIIFGLIKFYKNAQVLWLVWVSVFIAFVSMVRTEYLYVFIFSLPLLIGFQYKNKLPIAKYLFIYLGCFLLVVGPWSIRNYVHFNSYSLTQGYAEKTFAQRLLFNKMTWSEYGASFIYYLPDFGDSVAKKIFPGIEVDNLGFGEGSYYREGRSTLLKEINVLPDSERMNYLVDTYLSGNIGKHILVNIPLLWRGIFVAKYWGLFGFICVIIIAVSKASYFQKKNYFFLFVPFIPLFLLYPSVSVSIPRYYLLFIPFYSVAIGMVLY